MSYKLSHFYPVNLLNNDKFLVIGKSEKDCNKAIQYIFTDFELGVAAQRASKTLLPYETNHPINEEPYTPFFAGIIAGVCLASSAIWFYVCYLGETL